MYPVETFIMSVFLNEITQGTSFFYLNIHLYCNLCSSTLCPRNWGSDSFQRWYFYSFIYDRYKSNNLTLLANKSSLSAFNEEDTRELFS